MQLGSRLFHLMLRLGIDIAQPHQVQFNASSTPELTRELLARFGLVPSALSRFSAVSKLCRSQTERTPPADTLMPRFRNSRATLTRPKEGCSLAKAITASSIS